MASMPDCMAAMEKTSDKRCDCTRADCIAAMMGGASVLTLADLDGAPKTLVAPSLRPLPAPTVPLAGRNVGPEPDPPNRSAERRAGKECVSTGRSRWAPSH